MCVLSYLFFSVAELDFLYHSALQDEEKMAGFRKAYVCFNLLSFLTAREQANTSLSVEMVKTYLGALEVKCVNCVHAHKGIFSP